MDRLRSVVDELAAAVLGAAGDDELAADLVRLRVLIDRLEAEWLRRLAVFDRRQAWRARGGGSTAAWLRASCRLAPGAARERTVVARRLSAPARSAFAAGEIGYPHARLLVAASVATPEAAEQDDGVLVEAARHLDPAGLRRVVAHWRHALDPARAVREAEEAHERRRLYASTTFGGVVALDGELDAEGGATVLTALEALQQPVAGDRRTPAQRRADALVELARRALDAGTAATVGGERPHLTVTVALATLQGRVGSRAAELDWGGPVCAETARRLACDAGVSRVLMAGPSEVLEVGRRTRTVPPALRRALAVRDGGCVARGCDRPVAWTDAHHLRHWCHGGGTGLDNLVLLCRRHHRAVHEGGMDLARIRRDGAGAAGPARVRPPPGPA